MPPGIENDDYDSEGDILILEEFLTNDFLSLPENESFHFDIPSITRPPAKPPDDDEIEPNFGILTVKVVKDNKEEDKIRTKPDKIKSKREAWKSPDTSPTKSKPSQSQESIKVKKIQTLGTKIGKP
nr:hypothetical protein [Tanacetum cinerariifolium]